MKKNLFKTFAIVMALVSLFTTVTPVSATIQSESKIETRSKHTSNKDGGNGPASINLYSYVNAYRVTAASGNAGRFNGPRGTYVVRDWGVNSSSGTHGGSYWKLFDRNGTRLGTYNRNGVKLRP
ncbi:TPA: hypothetical protein ACGO9Z_000248 [Streptococcus suis]